MLSNPMVATAIGAATGIPPGLISAGAAMAGEMEKKKTAKKEAKKAAPKPEEEGSGDAILGPEVTAETVAEEFGVEPISEEDADEYELEALCDEVAKEVTLREFQPGRAPRTLVPALSRVNEMLIDAELDAYVTAVATLQGQVDESDEDDDELAEFLNSD